MFIIFHIITVYTLLLFSNFDKINATLVNIRNAFKKQQQSYMFFAIV